MVIVNINGVDRVLSQSEVIKGLEAGKQINFKLSQGIEFESDLFGENSEDVKIIFTNADGTSFSVILEGMGDLLANNVDEYELINILRVNDNGDLTGEQLASISDIASVAASSAAGGDSTQTQNPNSNQFSAGNGSGDDEGTEEDSQNEDPEEEETSTTAPSNFTDDTLTISGDVADTAIEDDDTIAAGDLDIVNAQNIQQLFTSQTDVAGEYGTFSVNAAGNWVYELYSNDGSENGDKVQALNNGEIVTETFTVVSENGTTSEDVTVTVTGTNDVTTIDASTTSTGSVTEDDAATASGSIDATDIDTNDNALAYSLNTTAGTYGNITIDSVSGDWVYTIDSTKAATQALNNNQAETETFTVTVTTQDGEEVTQDIQVSVNGTNDQPTVSTAIVNDQAEADGSGKTTIEGDFNTFTTDVDSNDTSFKFEVKTPTFESGYDSELITYVNADNEQSGVFVNAKVTGTATVEDMDIDYIRILDNGQFQFKGDFNALTASDTLEIRFKYNADDENGFDGTDGINETSLSADGWVTLTIQGTNDTAVVSGVSTQQVLEDSTFNVSGDLDVSDLDAGEAAFVPSSDVSLTLTNHASTLSLGTLMIDANGNWSYSLDHTNQSATINALDVGEIVTETFVVTTVDGTEKTISVEIHGQEDAATISVGQGDSNFELTTEDSMTPDLIASGTLSVSDADHDENGFSTAVTYTPIHSDGAQLGTLSITEDGNWNYTVSNDTPRVQELKTGEIIQQVFEVSSIDGSDSTYITINIEGINDIPEVSAVSATTSETTDGTITIFDSTSALTGTDVDANTNLTFKLVPDTVTVTPIVGDATFDASDITVIINGSGEYQVRGNFEDLSAGDSIDVTFNYIANDGEANSAPATVTLTINGTNDAPIASNITYNNYSETDLGNPLSTLDDAVFTASIDLTSENDLNDNYTFAIDPLVQPQLTSGSHIDGTSNYVVDMTQTQIVIDPVTGAYTISNPTFNNLANGETATIKFQYTVNDGTDEDFGRISFTVTGTNDQPTISSITQQPSDTLVEGDLTASLRADGTLVFSDLDSNDLVTVEHTYNDDITWNNGTLTATQIAELTTDFSVSTVNDTGTGFDGNGTWTYATDTNLDFLAAGETIKLSYEVNVDDGSATASADSNSETIYITITGTNDAPVLASRVLSGSVSEEVQGSSEIATLTDSDTIAFTDVDLSDTHTVSVSETAAETSANLGSLTASISEDNDGDGVGEVTWNYSVSNADVQYLGAGETKVETFTVTVEDTDANGTLTGTSSSQQVSVTITGTNDAPVLASRVLSGSVSEEVQGSSEIATLTDSDTIAFTDVDLSDTHTVSVSETAAETSANLGSLTASISEDNDGDGVGEVTWNYSVSNADVQYLGAGETKVETFTVTVEDTDANGTLTGTSSSQQVSVTITGTNDQPTISDYTETTNVEENTLTGSISLSDVVTRDIDTSDSHEFVVLDGATTIVTDTDSVGIGSITVSMDKDGNYSFIGAGIEKLGAGESATVSFDVQVIDDSGDTINNTSIAKTITVTIDGSNDAPVINSSNNGSVEENAANAGTTVASVVATDIDTNDTLTYSIFSVEGNESGPVYDYFTINSNGEISLTAAGTLAVNGSLINDFTFDIEVRASDDNAPVAAYDQEMVTVEITDSILSVPTLNLLTDDTGTVGDDLTSDRTPTLEIGALDDDILSVSISDASGVVATATRVDINSAWSGDNNNLNLNASTGEWTYTSTSLSDGIHTFTVTITDDGANSESKAYSVTIDGTEPRFSIVSGTYDFTVDEGSSVVGSAAVKDATDGQDTGSTITYSFTDEGYQEALFDIDASTGVISFKTNPDFETPAGESGTNDYYMNVLATDEAGNTETQAVKVSVNNTNDENPVVTSKNIIMFEDATDINLELTASDVDGDTLTVRFTNLPTNGTVTLADGTAIDITSDYNVSQLEGLQFDAASVGSDTLSYEVSDGDASHTQTGTVTVTTQTNIVSDGYSKYDGHYYKDVGTGSIVDARSTGDLVLINDAAENSYIDGLVDGDVWVNATDEGAEAGNDGTASKWTDLEGNSIDYVNWNANEPNDAGGNEDYVEMHNGGGWNDIHASGNFHGANHIVLEKESNALEGTSANDSLVYSSDASSIDGNDGDDTLVFDDSVGDIDLAGILAGAIKNADNSETSISNIENFDLRSGDHVLSNISYEDVIAMTGDDSHILKIITDDAGSGDKVQLSSDWTVGSADADGYTTYTSATDNTVTLLIDADNVENI